VSEAEPRGAIELAENTLGFFQDGRAELLPAVAGPPPRIAGYTVSAPRMSQAPPHDGEMHPDGDELVFLLSGRVTVVIEDEAPPRHVTLTEGQAVIVPRGVWHKVLLDEPSQLLHITPGPGGEHRPLR
jgi:mannose-6-phosphate isomerase-like protein (cupin superfamily)